MANQRKRDQKTPRRQFAALPCMAGNTGLMVMLVTSRDTGRWVLLKEWPKKRLSGSELAALEAFEEAGLEGEIASRAIGFYRYAKRMPNGREITCDVNVYPMRLARELDDWPERAQRTRRWFTMTDAAAAVNEAELSMLLLGLVTDNDASPDRIHAHNRTMP